MTTVVAVDFGATSVRVCRVDLSASPPRVEVVHRQPHSAVVHDDASLRWDWPLLVVAMERGLAAALEAGPVASIGIDTWGVDYGLLDRRGELVAPPFSYRDTRTRQFRDLVDRIGERELYERTGLQLQPFNTIFQIAAHRRDELEHANHLLLLPELLVHHLTGEIVGERTSAGTTGLVDLDTARWSPPLCEAAGVDVGLLPEILAAGTPVGTWRGVPVHLVGGHDTASAVAAMGAPPGAGTAFLSSGTWLLVGRECEEPDLSEGARTANFTNEPGVLGGYRFLRNVAGFWLLEQCRAAWGNPPLDELFGEAERAGDAVPAVDATDPRFLNPDDMEHEIVAAAGLRDDVPRGVVVRCIVESLARTTSTVLAELGGVTDVRLFGGGARVPLFARRLAEVSGCRVETGPVEAAALGNALVQGIALGVYQDLTHARSSLELVAS